MDYTPLLCPLSAMLSAVSVCRWPTGIAAFVILRRQSSNMFFIAMLFLPSLAIKILSCVMRVSKEESPITLYLVYSCNKKLKTPLELIYYDVRGLAQTSFSGHNFYVSFIDAYSRFTWLYLLKCKFDVFDVCVQFQTHVEHLLGHRIRHIQSDWGGKYHNLNTFFHKLGIARRVSYPHTHQQNGPAECKHRYIVETGLTLLAHASDSFYFWSDAFFTTYFLINRMHTRVLNMKTPVELLFHEPPDYTFLRFLGVLVGLTSSL
jgi:hypothetical protein